MKKNSLNLVHLKYFFDAVKEESISTSAKLNFVSQSAVSQAIAKLEEALNCELISHHPNRFKVTEKGLQLFENSRDIFQAVQKVETIMADPEGGTITLACTYSFAVTLLPKYLKQVKQRFPALRVRCRLGQYYAIKDWMRKGIVDMAFLSDNDDLTLFDCEAIYKGKFRLYVSKKCQDESQLSFLLDSEERRETNILKRCYRKRHGKDLPVQLEVSSWEVIAHLAEAGLGIGFFPDYVAMGHPQLKRSKQTFESIPYTLYALFPKNVKRSRHLSAFLEVVTSYSRESSDVVKFKSK